MFLRTNGRTLVLSTVLMLATMGSRRAPVVPNSAGTQAEPAHVTVIGADYAFVQLPARIAAGPTLFSFENRGTKRHEMSVALLKPGVTAESLVARGAFASVGARSVSDSIVGILIARPGELAGGQLYATLVGGRDYIVICTLRDTPDAQPHAMLGMVGGFHVQ